MYLSKLCEEIVPYLKFQNYNGHKNIILWVISDFIGLDYRWVRNVYLSWYTVNEYFVMGILFLQRVNFLILKQSFGNCWNITGQIYVLENIYIRIILAYSWTFVKGADTPSHYIRPDPRTERPAVMDPPKCWPPSPSPSPSRSLYSPCTTGSPMRPGTWPT